MYHTFLRLKECGEKDVVNQTVAFFEFCDHSEMNVRFVVDNVMLVHDFLTVLLFSAVIIIPLVVLCH
jgi:hypothetical protein